MDRKQELIATARAVAERLGVRQLRLETFLREAGLNIGPVYNHFGSWPALCEAAGLAPQGKNARVREIDIFLAMRDVFTACGDIVSREEFCRRATFGKSVLRRRFGTWRRALAAFRRWAGDSAPDFPHMALLDAMLPEDGSVTTRGAAAQGGTARPATGPGGTGQGAVARSIGAHGIGARSGPVPFWPPCGGRAAGEPLAFRALMFAPANEQGVVLLFGMVAAELGYAIQTVAPGFPDCTAMRATAPGRWESVRIEFEYRSHSFRDHGHDARDCDVIVCWEHDWPGCPLEVLSLRNAIAGLPRG